MPELPIEIWKDRINNEIQILDELNVIDKNSVAWHEASVDFWIKIKALGLKSRGGEGTLDLIPQKEHRILIRLNRSFPYPGGIDFSWHSEIYHPNIHPVTITGSHAQGTGYICLNVLKQWSRLSDLESTVKSLQMLVSNPNPDDPLNYDVCLNAAQFFKDNSMEDIKEKFNLVNNFKEKEKDSDKDDIIILD